MFIKQLSIMLACIVSGASFFTIGVAYRVLRISCYRCSSADASEYLQKKRDYLHATYNVQPVALTTDDNLSLSGLLILNENACSTVLLCHGYRGAKERLHRVLSFFPQAHILMFDFRGHGQSQGELISIGYYEQKDIKAAVDFIKTHEKTKQLPLVGFGFSMGAASLIGAAAQGVPFDGLILDSSFARLDDQLTRSFEKRTGFPKFPFMPVTKRLFEWFAHYRVEQVRPVESIQAIACPLFIVHSIDDDFTPVFNAHQLYEKATAKKELWLVSKSFHGKIIKDYSDEYSKRVNNFLQTYIL